MKLMTKEIEKRFKAIGSQDIDVVKDPIVVVKFFYPAGAGTWWAIELEEYRLKNNKDQWKYTNDFNVKEKAIKNGYKLDDIIFFGYASIFGDHNDEWGSFSLKELENFKGKFGLGIERDLHCGEKRISEFDIPSLKK